MKGQVVSLHLGLGSGLPKPRVEALELVAGFGAKGIGTPAKTPTGRSWWRGFPPTRRRKGRIPSTGP